MSNPRRFWSMRSLGIASIIAVVQLSATALFTLMAIGAGDTIGGGSAWIGAVFLVLASPVFLAFLKFAGDIGNALVGTIGHAWAYGLAILLNAAVWGAVGALGVTWISNRKR